MRRACIAMAFPRSTQTYRHRRPSQEALRLRLRELAADRVRWGYRRLHVLLRREGWAINLKRVHRLYRLEQLALRRKGTRRQVSCRHRGPRPAVEAVDQAWTLDFLEDATADGRKFRILAVLDVYTRECLAIRVEARFSSARVAEVLQGIALLRGVPSSLWTDNGPEFTGKMLDLWAYLNGVVLDYSRPGKPTDNAFIESFNGRLREECLNGQYFADQEEARRVLEAWRIDYNERRPHSSLGYLAPKEFAEQKAR